MALRRCENCGNEVPASKFCIRCGNELEGGELAMSRIARIPGASGVGLRLSGVLNMNPTSLSGVRRAFAAAPDEPVLRPTIVSSLFPQLPRPSMTAFRSCLALGLATVFVLGVAKLYPVALVAGAILLPLLVVLYMFDVNVFREQSLTVVAATLAWGAVAGAVVALIAKSLSPSGSSVFVGGHGSLILSRGIAIPVLSAILILAGPLWMLRYPRFATVLDGATFGASSASAFIGAEVIVQALAALSNGLQPPGALVPWLVQLAIIAVGLPILTMAAMGAFAGTVWLRFRATMRDRGALGLLGSPFVGAVLAAAALVLSAVAQLLLPSGVALAVIVVIAAASLLWLRRVVHVGLLEEALLIEDAPVIVCANCGHRTRRGSFCEACGISLAALPASRSAVQPIPKPSTVTPEP